MKILHITPAYEPAWHSGGVVRSASQLCRGLARLGHDVTVYTTTIGQDRRLMVPPDKPVDLGKVMVFYFKTNFNTGFAFSQTLYKACHQELQEFDIVHLASFWCFPGIPAGFEARKHRVPYVISTHGTLVPYSMAQKPFKKWLYFKIIEEENLRKASAIHYTAYLEREQMAYLDFDRPSFVIPNGLDYGEFERLPEKESARKELGIPKDTRVILYLGRLHARKGLDLLLRAFASFKNDYAPTLLILAGPDEGQLHRLQNLAAALDLQPRVWFPGFITPEKRNVFLRAADVMALIAHPGENFGYAAVEAMFAGIPVLVSNHVGISREVVADGAGVAVPLTIDAVANAIIDIFSNPERLAAKGRAAAASARRRYEIDIVARQMAMAYEDILTGRRSPGLSWSDE